MTMPQTKQIINLLKHKGVLFDNGLLDIEVAQIQEKFDINFPPDLKQFLQLQLPISEGFINWRQGLINEHAAQKIWNMLNWAWEGMLFCITNNNFWVESWGNKPGDHERTVKIAKQHYDSYPKLIPIYGHRFIPGEPNEAGNPVFSVYGMDIIYYGYNLATYFANEFYFKLNDSFRPIAKPNRKIEFWSWCVEKN
jgi:hypothetical protein